jgi:histidyl-tRNA synthetase
LGLAQQLREAGLSTWFDASGARSLKNQFKQADAEGCSLALILGADELAKGEIGLKDLKAQQQESVKLSDAVAEIKKRLGR